MNKTKVHLLFMFKQSSVTFISFLLLWYCYKRNKLILKSKAYSFPDLIRLLFVHVWSGFTFLLYDSMNLHVLVKILSRYGEKNLGSSRIIEECMLGITPWYLLLFSISSNSYHKHHLASVHTWDKGVTFLGELQSS